MERAANSVVHESPPAGIAIAALRFGHDLVKIPS